MKQGLFSSSRHTCLDWHFNLYSELKRLSLFLILSRERSKETLLETSSNPFLNNSTSLSLQFNCFYSPKTKLHFIFSSYNTDKKQGYCSINAMFSLCNSSVFTFYFLCFSHLKPIILHPISYLITIKRASFYLHIS